MTERPSFFIPLIAVLTLVSWASAYPVVRLAMQAVPAIPLAALRYFLAALCAVLWLWSRKKPLPKWADWPRFLLCGIIGIALYNIFFNLGEQSVPSATTSLLIATAPILTGVIAVMFCGEYLAVWGWIGSLLSFCGVLMIVAGTGFPAHTGSLSGIGLILAAALCLAVFVVLQRPLVQHYGGITVAAYILIIGALILLPWLGQGVTALHHSPPLIWLYVIELALFPAALGYAGWGLVIGAFGAARSATYLYLLPPFTFVLSFCLEGVWPDSPTLIGGSVVMLGLCLTQFWGHNRPVS